MRAFGYELTVKAVAPASPVYDNRGGWWPLIREPFTGAWQRNISWTTDTVLAYHAVYSCITLIASDVGKLRMMLVEQDADGIWTETQSAAFSPVLRRPNHYQNHIQFKEWWITSKLIRGNAYALKQRDNRGVVEALYLLDPSRVKVLVGLDGSVFYELSADTLSGVKENVVVPAREIIHDRMNCIFHPLVGTSPIFACGMSAHGGQMMQNNSTVFFGNSSIPAGTLTAPGTILPEEAERLSARWKMLYSGENAGKVAVLGNGLKFEQLRMTSVDAQLIEQLKYTAENICGVFHVPAFKIGAGAMPTYSNAEILDQRYYSDCLQTHIEHLEACLDEGLGVNERLAGGKQLGVELDLDGLLRMDTATMVDTLVKAAGGAIMKPDEARKKMDLPPVPGGDTIYLQQQNFSLSALSKRDARPDPFAPAAPPPPKPDPEKPDAEDVEDEDDDADDDVAKAFDSWRWEASVTDYEVAHVW